MITSVFSLCHDIALTNTVYKKKLAPVYPVSLCSEIIRHCLKLTSRFLFTLHSDPMKLLATGFHRGHELSRSPNSDVKIMWTVSLRTSSVNFVSVPVFHVCLWLKTLTEEVAACKIVKSWELGKGKGVREKQLLVSLGNTGRRWRDRERPGCVAWQQKRWEG